MNILFLCRKKDLGWAQSAFARALERRGISLTFVDDDVSLDEDVLKLLANCPERPSLILHPELTFPILPQGLTDLNIITACFQIDTYAYTKRRIRWSMLFDHPIVFHPGFQEKFARAGHPGAITIYHAADRGLFDKSEVERIFDVGWVGRSFANIHNGRRRMLAALSEQFKLNDWEKFYSFEEMADVYLQSKVVVNVARDDFPQDANMRAFEAMAAGCLLISRVPSELTAIGFQEGFHFVGYQRESEVTNLVKKYLSNADARRRIAASGRYKVLTEHTYDNRIEFLLQKLEEHAGKLIAPARKWTAGRTRLCYLDFYVSQRLFDCAYTQMHHIARSDVKCTLAGASLIGRAWAGELRRRVASRLAMPRQATRGN